MRFSKTYLEELAHETSPLLIRELSRRVLSVGAWDEQTAVINNLSERQQELLDFIILYREQNHNRSPSSRDMRDGLGMKSTNQIHELVKRLETKGAIFRTPGVPRSIIPRLKLTEPNK